MTDQVLDVLKFVLLGLLYLFFARVLWAVWSEVRAPRGQAGGAQHAAMPVGMPVASSPEAATVVAARPKEPAGPREKRPTRGQAGRAARLVILEPKQRRGTAFPVTGEITIGREPTCTVEIPDDKFVSSLHARIFDVGGQPMVEDLGSTNGSFLNGNKLVGAKLLHPGDRIQIGYTVLEAQ
jgi:hypothetical protein